MTRDDQWNCKWDGDGARQRGDGQTAGLPAGRDERVPGTGGESRQNRLIAMETRAELIGPVMLAADARRLEFTYDYMGRRVRKLVRSGWNGTQYATTASDTKFIYQGWNLVAQYDALSTFTLTLTFTWGPDLSGTLQGAGGVGGLLMTTEGSAKFVYAY